MSILKQLAVIGFCAFGIAACTTGYIKVEDLNRREQGPDKCSARCHELGMEMGAMVLVSDTLPGCVCTPRPATTPSAPTPSAPTQTPPQSPPPPPPASVQVNPGAADAPKAAAAGATTGIAVVLAAAAAAHQQQMQAIVYPQQQYVVPAYHH